MLIKKLNIFSLFFMNFLNFIDCIVTYVGIRDFGLFVEGNELIKYFVINIGLEFTVLIKFIAVLLASLLFIYRWNNINNKYKDFCYKIDFFGILFLNIVFIIIIYYWMVFLL